MAINAIGKSRYCANTNANGEHRPIVDPVAGSVNSRIVERKDSYSPNVICG
jgi:hypothetical protein